METVKHTFLKWLQDFSTVDDETQLFEALSDCKDELPVTVREPLGLARGSTFRDAVELLERRWRPR